MKGILESEHTVLKAAVCNGEQDAIRALTSYYFAEIWANMLLGEIDEQADALISLEIDLQNDLSDFCKSTQPVEQYLRKRWKEKLVGFRKRTLAFDEAFMSTQKVGKDIVQDTPNPKDIVSLFPHHYFLSSLSPVLRVIFETKYFQGLNGRNGLFQVAHFLLNAATIGDSQLSETLKSIDGLYEPLIPDFLTDKAKAVFTNQVSDRSESLKHLLEHLPTKRLSLKKAFHAYDMKVFRSHNQFKEKLATIRELNILEQTFILINDYLKIEDLIEFWVQLNVDSLREPHLRKALDQADLLEERIQQKHRDWRSKAIIKNIKLGKKRIEAIQQNIENIQQNIAQQLNQNIHWKIN